jgi:DNA-binding beta-propeller fold protein YncE
MQGFWPISTALAVAAVLGLAGAAGAAEGDPHVKSCYATANATPCAQLQPPFRAADAELSPDGRHLYAAVWDGGGGFNGIRLFDVGAGGALTARSGAAFTASEAVHDVDLSPDGRNVYLAAGGQLVVLNRDGGSGALAQAQSIPGITAFHSLAVSPDSANVYARGPSHVAVFDRNTSNGTLTQKLGLAGCLMEEALIPTCTGAVGIAGTGLEIVVSPDGRNLYVPNDAPGGVAVFRRDGSGALGQSPGTGGGCVTVGGTSGGAGGAECAPGSPTLSQARAANLDAQGAFLIVSAAGGNTVFRRDPANGALSQTDCLDELGGGAPPAGCHEVKGAAGGDAAISPNGLSVVLNANEVGLSAFNFNRATGQLAQRPTRGCFSAVAVAPCEHVPGLLGGLGGVTFSPNGLSFFSAFRGGSVASFELDVAPACQPRSVSVPRNTTVFVPLACTDANGDAVTLEVTAPPTNGALGIVDQQRKRVSYRPEINYKGRDVFQYRGTARGTRGNAAVVTLNVLARGRRIDRTPPNTRIRRGPPKTTRSRTASFRFTSTERRSRFECKLDKRRWARCRSPKRYTGLKRGKHTFRVRATDRAGNTDLTPAKRTWIRKR